MGQTNERSVDPYLPSSTMALSRFRTASTQRKGGQSNGGSAVQWLVSRVARNQRACASVERYQGFYAKPSICCQAIFPLINYFPGWIPICHFAAVRVRGDPARDRSGWRRCDSDVASFTIPKEVFVTLVTNYNK